MKTVAILLALFLTSTAYSQERSNDDINRQVRSLGVEHIEVTYDQASNMSKLMAVSENFSNRDAANGGVLAMNFAMGFFYPGNSLKAAPQTVHFSFWVLTKKPRFATDHHLTADLDGRELDLGEARYAAKPNQDLEYLNFELTVADLTAMASSNKLTFRIGPRQFYATASQLKLIQATKSVAGF